MGQHCARRSGADFVRNPSRPLLNLVALQGTATAKHSVAQAGCWAALLPRGTRTLSLRSPRRSVACQKRYLVLMKAAEASNATKGAEDLGDPVGELASAGDNDDNSNDDDEPPPAAPRTARQQALFARQTKDQAERRARQARGVRGHSQERSRKRGRSSDAGGRETVTETTPGWDQQRQRGEASLGAQEEIGGAGSAATLGVRQWNPHSFAALGSGWAGALALPYMPGSYPGFSPMMNTHPPLGVIVTPAGMRSVPVYYYPMIPPGRTVPEAPGNVAHLEHAADEGEDADVPQWPEGSSARRG